VASVLTEPLYTTSAVERDNAVKKFGYTFEGVAGYVSPVKAANLVPWYRLYDSPPIDHLYTTSAGERANAIKNLGYYDEGNAGFVSPSTAC